MCSAVSWGTGRALSHWWNPERLMSLSYPILLFSLSLPVPSHINCFFASVFSQLLWLHNKRRLLGKRVWLSSLLHFLCSSTDRWTQSWPLHSRYLLQLDIFFLRWLFFHSWALCSGWGYWECHCFLSPFFQKRGNPHDSFILTICSLSF